MMPNLKNMYFAESLCFEKLTNELCFEVWNTVCLDIQGIGCFKHVHDELDAYNSVDIYAKFHAYTIFMCLNAEETVTSTDLSAEIDPKRSFTVMSVIFVHLPLEAMGLGDDISNNQIWSRAKN